MNTRIIKPAAIVNLKTDVPKAKKAEAYFCTIKRGWGAYYFLTKRKATVTAEISLSFLAYNLKRVINILGNEEILRRLMAKKEPALG